MSAPKTNVKKQERRHKPVLYIMAAAASVAVIAIFGIYVFGANEELDEAASSDVIEAE